MKGTHLWGRSVDWIFLDDHEHCMLAAAWFQLQKKINECWICPWNWIRSTYLCDCFVFTTCCSTQCRSVITALHVLSSVQSRKVGIEASSIEASRLDHIFKPYFYSKPQFPLPLMTGCSFIHSRQAELSAFYHFHHIFAGIVGGDRRFASILYLSFNLLPMFSGNESWALGICQQ